MTWATFSARLDFFNGTQSWGTANPSVAAVLSPAEISAITGHLQSLYDSSSATAAWMESLVASAPLKIAKTTNAAPGYSSPASNFFAVDLVAIGQTYFINTTGSLVGEDPRVTIVHELLNIRENFSPGPEDVPHDEAYLNGANADQAGPIIALQNPLATNLGLSDRHQASYHAAGLVGDSRIDWLRAQPSSFTDGATIDNVRFGD